TLHLWSQVVGKIRLATTPWLNHSWHVALYVDASGLTTSLISGEHVPFELRFDFVEQALICRTIDGRRGSVPLMPQSVAQFKAATMGMLAHLGIAVTIRDLPCEIADATPLSQDHAPRAYDTEAARRFHRVLSAVDRVFK